MRGGGGSEQGQAMVEFAIIGLVLMMLTVGLIDAGRAFYQYNAVSTAARFGARWGSVVGGTCSGARGASTSDWCNQLGQAGSSDFWNTLGNYPLQGNNPCPTAIQSPPPFPNPYYTVSNYIASTATTIVGAVAQKFDTSTSSSTFIAGALTAGFDLSKLKVCIQLPSEAYSARSAKWTVGYGYIVSIFVYYPFSPVGPLLDRAQLNLIASSQYQVE